MLFASYLNPKDDCTFYTHFLIFTLGLILVILIVNGFVPFPESEPSAKDIGTDKCELRKVCSITEILKDQNQACAQMGLNGSINQDLFGDQIESDAIVSCKDNDKLQRNHQGSLIPVDTNRSAISSARFQLSQFSGESLSNMNIYEVSLPSSRAGPTRKETSLEVIKEQR